MECSITCGLYRIAYSGEEVCQIKGRFEIFSVSDLSESDFVHLTN